MSDFSQPLSLFEIMTGKKPPASGSAPGQVPSGPGNPNQGANWMPPQGSQGSPASNMMPSQPPGSQWNGWLPQIPGSSPMQQPSGKALFGPNGVTGMMQGVGGGSGGLKGGAVGGG